MPVSEMNSPVLETRGISKQFDGVGANRDISIRLDKGEIIALLGENGAGKSTLMNILFGLYRPTSGSILIDGSPVTFDSPRDAIAKGIGMVHQHFMLVPTLTVTQNVILGDEPLLCGHVLYRQARAKVAEISERYGLVVDPDARIEDLSVGLQQRVEILKTLYRNARVLILDEPTAVLTPREVVELFSVLKRLAENGTSIIIITHKLEEVMHLSERVYILRRGEMRGERRTEAASAAELANLMVGRDVVLQVERRPPPPAPAPVFRIEGLSARNARGLPILKGVNLAIGAGEILGIAGVEGNGQKELCETITGLAEADSGRILLRGGDLASWGVKTRMGKGMGYVPQDRRGSALVMPFSVEENLVLGRTDSRPLSRCGFLDFRALRSRSESLMREYDIRASGPEARISTLSGGNQQKTILAREFSTSPPFLLLSQPTRGLDVGAIEYVYKRILELKEKGSAILLVSMELEEIFALSDRIAVLHGGEVVFETAAAATTEAEIGEYMIRGRAAELAS